MVFAAMFSVLFLHRHLNRWHYLGIALCVVRGREGGQGGRGGGNRRRVTGPGGSGEGCEEGEWGQGSEHGVAFPCQCVVCGEGYGSGWGEGRCGRCRGGEGRFVMRGVRAKMRGNHDGGMGETAGGGGGAS